METSIRRPLRKDTSSFRESPLVMVLANFSKPTSEVMPKARQIILKWARELYPDIPDSALEGKPFDLERPGDPCRAITPTGDANGYWAMRMNRIDPDVAGRVWTLEVHLASNGPAAHFGLRMSVLHDGIYEIRPPRFIRELDQSLGLRVDGLPLNGQVMTLRRGKSLDNIIRLIEDENREAPVVVFSTSPDGEVRQKAAESLAKLTRGLAHVCIVDEDASFAITRHFGKALSTFYGAVRIYPCHFTQHADPFSMPLYLPHRIDRISDQRLVDLLLGDVSAMSLEYSHDEMLPRFSTLRKTQTRYELKIARDQAQASSLSASEQIAALQSQLQKAVELEQLFVDSLDTAERNLKDTKITADELKAENFRLRAQVESLTQALRQGGSGNLEVPIPDSLEDLQTWAEKHYPSSLLITNKCGRLAADSVFEDVPTVYRVLQLLATEYRDSKMGVEGAFARFEQRLTDLGLHMTPSFANGSASNSGPEAVQKHRGVNRVLDWHIKNGGNTRDPARCLRVYFFWSEEDQMPVVGALPAHIRTILS